METKTKKQGRPASFIKEHEDRLAREFLEDTADLLEGHWIKNTLHDGQGNHCAVGAMMAVAKRKKYHGSGVYVRAKKMFWDTIRPKNPYAAERVTNHSIYAWNDAYAKNEQEVVRRFREASSK